MKVIILSVAIFIVTLIVYGYYGSTQQLYFVNDELAKCTQNTQKERQTMIERAKEYEKRYEKQKTEANTVLEAKQKEWKDIVDGLTTKKYDGDWVLLGSKNRSTYIHIDGNNVTLIEGSELEQVSPQAPVSKETKGKLYGDSIVFETKAGYQLTGNLRLSPSKQLILEMNMIGVDSSSSRSVRTFNKLNQASPCNKLVLYDDQKGALNLSDIVVYDIWGGTVPLTSKNVSMDDPWDTYPISNIVDKNENTFMHNANNVRKITVTFDRSDVSIVVIRNRKDCCQTRANGLMLKLFSDNSEVYSSYPVKDWSGSAVYENGGTNLNNPYGYNYIIFRTSNPEPIISNQFVY